MPNYLPRTRRHRPWHRLAALLIGLVGLGAGWFFLAPSALGGGTSYVVTDGVSMQPRFHTGDLAVVRPASDYRVGDIVAYRSRQLHVTVLHRIVAITADGRYIFRGDHNSWRDPERVTRAQLIGALWFAVPGLGGRLEQLRSPATMATLAGLAALLLLSGAGARAHRRRRRRRGPEPKWLTPKISAPRAAGIGVSYGGLALTLLALAACAGLAIVAWSTPTRRTVPTQVSYRQSGAFAYAASTITGPVYNTGQATTGQPIFTRLAGPVQVRFAYTLHARHAEGISGTASLSAVVASPSGWMRTFPLESPTPFAGSHAVVTGIVHLRKLERFLQRVATATAVPDASFTLTLVPMVRLHGRMAGQQFQASYAPQLPFTLTPLALSPPLPEGPAGAVRGQAGSGAVFHPGANGSATSAARVSVDLGAGRLSMPVAFARIAALIGLLASLTAAVLAGRLLRRTRLSDEPTRIRARYGESIVTVVHSSLGRHTDLVQVKSIEELARIAERYESMIIHEQTDLGHAYLVADGSTLYAYLLEAPGSERGLRDRLTSERGARTAGVSSTSRGVTRTIPA
ncbi:MAG TPA: signal peptidase I [Gaiellales bacterium]